MKRGILFLILIETIIFLFLTIFLVCQSLNGAVFSLSSHLTNMSDVVWITIYRLVSPLFLLNVVMAICFLGKLIRNNGALEIKNDYVHLINMVFVFILGIVMTFVLLRALAPHFYFD